MLNISVTPKGFFRCITQGPRGSRVSPWTPNTVLPAGLDYIGQQSDYLDVCQVGRSLAVVNPLTQTGLVDFAAASSTRTAAFNEVGADAPFFGASVISYSFPAGTLSGRIFEIAVGPSADPLVPTYNRVLITDLQGVPSFTDIAIDEDLTVQFQSVLLAPLEQTTTFLHNGVSHTARILPLHVTDPRYWAMYNVNGFATASQAVRGAFSEAELGGHILAYSGDLRSETSVPLGEISPARFIVAQPYVPGSYQAVAEAEWDIRDALFTGGTIRSFTFALNPLGSKNGGESLGAFQVEVDPPIVKNDAVAHRGQFAIRWGAG